MPLIMSSTNLPNGGHKCVTRALKLKEGVHMARKFLPYSSAASDKIFVYENHAHGTSGEEERQVRQVPPHLHLGTIHK